VSPEEIKDVQLRMGAGVAMMDELMTLPETFMWTKMGWESGVRLADILRQKEVERQAQGGLFLWGIGTTVSAERLRALRERVQVPHVVFTKMVSGSKPVDYEPDTASDQAAPAAPDAVLRDQPRRQSAAVLRALLSPGDADPVGPDRPGGARWRLSQSRRRPRSHRRLSGDLDP